MNLRADYKKFVKHFSSGGLLYALWRGIKYFLFLIKINRDRVKDPVKNKVSKRGLKISCSGAGVNIFFDGVEITGGIGLNTAVNTLGNWTDSARAKWRILAQEENFLKIKIIFNELPLTQIWALRVNNSRRIEWQIDMEVEEWLCVDEMRILCLTNSRFKTWVSDYEEGDFPRLEDRWLDLALKDKPASLIGVRFPLEGKFLPSFAIESSDKNLSPIVQNPTLDIDARLIGFRRIEPPEKRAYGEGDYRIFTGEIRVFQEECLMDEATEIFRKGYLRTKIGEGSIRPGKKMKVLLVNLPWQKEGRWGVRAGSRWPHIKDNAEEGTYMPFPFFLAYSASLLKRNAFEAYLIDALADKIPKARLMERVKNIAPDLLVVETSTPSLNNDMEILQEMANKDFQICLCGPDANIRDPKFLKKNAFIDYVLIGEYEHALLRLVEKLSCSKDPDDIDGLVYRNGGEVLINPPGPLIDLDLLPWPLREGLPMDKYLDTPGGLPLPSVQMLASRGCPFGCNFCLWPQVMYHGAVYRARNIIDVVDEMEYLIRKKGFKSVYFDDDTFNIGRERMSAFCRELKKRGLEKTPWAIMARPDLMDEGILAEMKEAGLTAVKYGVESASQELLTNCGKGMDLKKAEKMILLTKELGVKTHLTFTFGLPGETGETIQKTIGYALRLKPHSLQFSITTPFPGTAYFKELDKNGQLASRNWDDYDGNCRSVIKSGSLSDLELESARQRAHRAWEESSNGKKDLRAYLKHFEDLYRQGGLMFSLKKAAGSLRKDNIKGTAGKIRDHYLDVLGVLNGKYAFKGPRSVQVDLTDQCNNNCLACWCNSPLLSKERLAKPKEALPTGLVKKLIDELRAMGTREIFFSGGGEPFMHPDILEVLEYAKSRQISCSVNTNFTLVDEKIINRLIELKLDHLTVSIWAGTAQAYKALHPNKDQEDFYRIRDFLILLNSKKCLQPHVKIYNVICSLNCYEIRQMLDLASEVKADSVEFTVVDTIPDGTDKLILSHEHRDAVLRQFKEAQKIPASVVNLEHFLRRVSNSGAHLAQYDSEFINNIPCYVGWLFARIMPNGDVNSCLKSHRFPVGNIHSQSFSQIWNSQKQVYFRQKALIPGKDDRFFTLIGNDPDCRVGCYKSCDDIGRNISMHNRINSVSRYEKGLLKVLAKSGLGKTIGLSKR